MKMLNKVDIAPAYPERAGRASSRSKAADESNPQAYRCLTRHERAKTTFTPKVR